MQPVRIRRVALLLAIMALAPALALAQDGLTGRRMDPGVEPGDRTSGTELHDWSIVPVAGLATGSVLGTLWADPKVVLVWSTQTRILTPLGTQTPRLGDGDEPPDPGGGTQSTSVTNSTLLRYDGSAFSVALATPGETGVSVFGVDAKNVYAATDLANGGVRLYHLSGNHWRVEKLPDGLQGPAGSIAGEPGNMYFRAGNSLLKEQGQGRHWAVAYMNDQLVPGNEIVFLGPDQVAAPGDHGTAIWNGSSWRWETAANPMHIDGAWGARDAAGELHLFAAGSALDHSGPCIWQLCETAARDLEGQYDLVFSEPTSPDLGTGLEIWGTSAHDQYGIGFENGCGCLYQYNGVAWVEISPVGEMAIPSGLSGTARGDVWVALRDGNLLQGVRREPLVVEPSVPYEEALAAALPPDRVSVWREAPGSHVVVFTLAEPQDVSVAVFDVTGRCVAQLGRERLGAGLQRVSWNARGIPAGLYFCRVTAGTWSGTGKVLVGR